MWKKASICLTLFIIISAFSSSFSFSFSFSLSSSEQFSSRVLNLKTLRYELDVKVDYENQKIFGTCLLTIQNPADQAVSRVPLILYRLLKVTSVASETGESIPYEQKVLSFEDWEKLQVNYVDVHLPQALASGKSLTLAIDYEGYILGYTEAGWMYVKDHVDRDFTIVRMDGYGYPVVGYPSDKVNRKAGLQSFDYLISVTVPDDLAVANGGKLVDKVIQDGQVTYTYANIKPAWRIDMPVAAYGVAEDKNNKLKVFHLPEDKENAGMILDAMQKALRLYTGWFGPADAFQGFTIIEVPEGYGSQADVTSILQTADAFKERSNLTALYHEISHIWNVRALDPLPPRFESEGLAMFLQYLVQERLDNRKDALKKGYDRLSQRFIQQCQRNPRCKDVSIIEYGREDLTDLSYTKGMLFFTILYRLMGEEDFLETMGGFYQKYVKTGATAQEFLNYLKQRSKADLDKLYREWIYGNESTRLIFDKIPLEEILRRYIR
jgi:hypothetical protein